MINLYFIEFVAPSFPKKETKQKREREKEREKERKRETEKERKQKIMQNSD